MDRIGLNHSFGMKLDRGSEAQLWSNFAILTPSGAHAPRRSGRIQQSASSVKAKLPWPKSNLIQQVGSPPHERRMPPLD